MAPSKSKRTKVLKLVKGETKKDGKKQKTTAEGGNGKSRPSRASKRKRSAGSPQPSTSSTVRSRLRRRGETRVASCSPHPSPFPVTSATSSNASGKAQKRRKRRADGWSSKAVTHPGTSAMALMADTSTTSEVRPSIQPVTIGKGADFKDVGGLNEIIEKLKEMIVLPFRYPEIFKKFGCPRGVLFYGPPGTGKTLMARALVHELSKGAQRVAFFCRSGTDILSKWFGESESNLRELFEEAKANQPSVIFFDELDALAPARSSQQDHVFTTIVGTLLTLLDGLQDREQVVVIGATNRPDALDSALRRPGRFDRELFFPPPNLEARREILRINIHDACPELITWLAERTSGFCGADITLLIREAFLCAVKEAYPAIYNTAVKVQIQSGVKVLRRHYEAALASFRPSEGRSIQGWREVSLTLPTVYTLPSAPVYQVLRRHYEAALASFRPSEGRSIQGWREVVPDILTPLLQEDRQALVSVITTRCPWMVPNKVRRGEICSQMRVLLCPDEGVPDDAEYVSKAVLAAFGDCNIWTMDDAYVMSLTCVDVMQVLAERIHDVGRHRSPTVLYMPRLEELGEALQVRVGTGLDRLLGMLPRWAPLLVLLTSVRPYSQLSQEHQTALRSCHLHRATRPGQPQRHAFFTSLLDEGRGLSEKSIDQLVELTQGWSVQELGQLSVRVCHIRSESKQTPSVASLIKELTIERELANRRIPATSMRG